MSLSTALSIIQTQINRYCIPIILSFGITGSLLNILLFSRREFRNISCCIYFLSASVGMLIAMCFGLMPRVYSVYYPDPINTINAFCKTRIYFGQCSALIYRWLLTMACIDRYTSSTTNARIRWFANVRIAYRVVLITTMILILFSIHNLFYRTINKDLCILSSVGSIVYNTIYVTTLGGVIPPLIMIICAVLIRNNLRNKRERRRTNAPLGNEDPSVRILQIRDQQTLVMLFVQIIFYILLMLPWTIFIVYSAFTSKIKHKTNNRIVIDLFIEYATETLGYAYSTLSFYLYTLTSHTFRQKLLKIIYSILKYVNRCYIHPQRIQPN
ncbi:unnamed protein product [Adineta steineri]|uniref:G-protein coupled receptors family 1 profile domain-containing protein n=1 Tax=Adineta steineri TaxID=433720 RepID=A0A816DRL4_9BILA|nr:unnamed protein product [Adineta steineri]CAF1638194.1 unnamed protein product [Adineta steineri]